MHSLSHIFARLPGALAASLALTVPAAAPAQAATIAASKAGKVGKNMVGANDVQSVVAYLQSKGVTVKQLKDSAGGPMLEEDNNYYQVFFSCDDDKANCNAVQFRACYADYPDANLDATNAMTRDFYLPKSYIDKDGNACIEMPIATGLKGISYEAMDVSFDAFTSFTEDADDYFGAQAE